MAARGDARAFAAVYERHHEALYRYCRSILGHEEDARDALHNTMLKAWEALRRGDRDLALRPWLFRIAHNEAVTVLRRRPPHRELDEADAIATRSLDEALDLRQRLAGLRADLAALPERQRSALLLRELLGLCPDEIAAVLAVSPAAARQTIYEARLALQEAEAGRNMTCAAIQQVLSDGDGRIWRGRRIRGHLRACHACSAFEAALRRRPRQLAALAAPLSAAESIGHVVRLLAAGSASSTAAGPVTAPLAGATTAISNLASGLAAKLAVGSVVAALAGGVVGLERVQHHSPASGTPAAVRTPSEPDAALKSRPRAAPQRPNARGSAPVAATADRVQSSVATRQPNERGPAVAAPHAASEAPSIVPGTADEGHVDLPTAPPPVDGPNGASPAVRPPRRAVGPDAGAAKHATPATAANEARRGPAHDVPRGRFDHQPPDRPAPDRASGAHDGDRVGGPARANPHEPSRGVDPETKVDGRAAQVVDEVIDGVPAAAAAGAAPSGGAAGKATPDRPPR
jgi:RNA polymerase sigma factor (sigma-70 family)